MKTGKWKDKQNRRIKIGIPSLTSLLRLFRVLRLARLFAYVLTFWVFKSLQELKIAISVNICTDHRRENGQPVTMS